MVESTVHQQVDSVRSGADTAPAAEGAVAVTVATAAVAST